MRFVGVIVQDTEPDARRFLAEARITFPAGLDADLRIARSFRLVGMPLTVFLTRDGHIADHVTGPLSAEDFVAKVRGLL